MPEKALINRAVSTISVECEFLLERSMLSKPQFQSIMAQLPKKGAIPSPYVDPRFNPSRAQQFDPTALAREAQDPKNPAHPDHPKHDEWAKQMVAKFGNASL
ncbi:Uncharacterized protein BP5553_03211 [Venustampulla echinocandica]|uniref:Uncharacterized protein n=1 Tax=Venustampulla echinocandica TaxID=2656787 RepID=A0A370TTL8_9HELO|nr:Uncharacterized protein BP5553_03211 [Venustampulla echinocandica]RDL38871.1 Uncharacterized protein BP5553_03211 [Venustampulla echinocandica]